MPRAPRRACTVPGCPELVPKGRCPQHARDLDRSRGTSTERGYTSPGHQRFRRLVLARDPVCVCTDERCRHHAGPCTAPSEHADHWPLSRRELIVRGLTPDDPQYGHGLCMRCHNSRTGRDRA